MTNKITPAAAWRTQSSTVVHRAEPYFAVRRDEAVRPDGQPAQYHHVVSPGAAVVLALDAAGRVVLTRQWIYTHGEPQLRLPSGGIDPVDAGSPQAAAARELLAETGLRADKWASLGAVHSADSFSNHIDHLFLASGLIEPETPVTLDGDEADLRVHRVSLERAAQLVDAGAVPHAGSQVAIQRLVLRSIPSHVVFRACSSHP
ncbi:NUDIX domain-containing protein [Nocardia sp. NRRL S-836]|uniref:NUDIX domain-containing protein n=1 Tax=Nocardia sp. NRRL S-836 TaxID=1519492 RepID=UPI000A5E1FE5|nr:NUDIX domain-containing protein [Nocardia sp. NRRL S-836]